MSIAAISSSFVTAVRQRAAPVSPTAAGPVAEAQGAHKGGRRHELVDAMQQVLGVDGVDSQGEQQAVFRFAHALMHDLRKIDANADGPTAGTAGAGRAWGRRSYDDLPQRLEALAAASAGPASASPVAPPAAERPVMPVTPTVLEAPLSTPAVDSNTPTTLPSTATSAATFPAALDELPLQPDPLTATSAALHLMQVPSSRLLEAYAALHQALGDSDATLPSSPTPAPASSAAPDANRAALADFLTRLSTTLTADAPASLPAGSLLNARA